MENYSLMQTSVADLTSLKFIPTSSEKLHDDMLEIEILLTPINFKEILYALGLLPLATDKPFQFGLECVGIVTKVGREVSNYAIGDLVLAIIENAFSRFIQVKTHQVTKIPESLNLVDAATIPIPFLTAYYALKTVGRLTENETVLIHSATGSVGLAAIQVAKLCGARIFATAGTTEKREYLQSLGIEYVMDSRTLDFAKDILTITQGKGVDVVLNSLAGDFLKMSLTVVSENGRFIEIGKRDIIENMPLGLNIFDKNISFSSVNISTTLPNFENLWHEILHYFSSKKFIALPYKIFAKEHVSEAFNYMARAKHIGRVIVAHKSLEEINGINLKAFNKPKSMNIGLLTQEACDLFDEALQFDLPQVIISSKNLHKRIENYQTGMVNVENELSNSSSRNFHQRPDLSTDYIEPKSSVEISLVEIWQQFFNIAPIGIYDNFFELGGDSLLAVQLIAEIRNKLAIRIPAHTLIEAPTIVKLTEKMSLNLNDQIFSPLLVKLNPDISSNRNLFMIHPVGGTVYLYHDVASLSDITVYGVQANSIFDPNEESPTSIEQFAASYIEAIRTVQPHGPYLLGGSSFGGVVAYEMAQQLLKDNEQTEYVLMLDTAARDQLTDDKLKDDLSILIYLSEALNPGIKIPVTMLEKLSYEEQLKYFMQSSNINNKLLPNLPLDKIQNYLKLFKNNLSALLHYEPKPYSGDVIFFKALEHDAYNAIEPEKSWIDCVKGQLFIHETSGNHVTMNFKPHIIQIAEIIRRYLQH